MQTIETEFNAGGFTLRQVNRAAGQWAVYEQSKGGRVTSYELVRIRIAPAQTIMKREYPEREVYPGNESWGTDGFTIVDREEAIERMHRIAEIQAKQPPRK